ncbi:DNA-directed DNA polymerase epsilon, subunit B [Pleurotus ostreatus]|uniref:DNA polymerase epsilon subunit n=2 Tax=Pleurotus ostreatus TaxID=5322 RepID=A0A067NMT2_PLEO1|nr:DNA-directed DNA polymerase epsilon, subunit B [Pleurotus ostreatus]KAF7433025.1 DNA-directed DNA polymerase epsilon, subunit B [Pleurotus ostreatus]KDQ29368.1 hypothetical protein PLEOSDRAFT_50365 [Pleurotus ostreatus PC15]
MADLRHRTIIKAFLKFSNSLGPDALELVEEILDHHEIADEDVESSVETLAAEYNKQEDATMKVAVDVLRRVYQALQDSEGTSTDAEKDVIDPESHLFVINAYEMPAWRWSTERGTFERVTTPLTTSGSAESRVLAVRDRLNIIKQCVLRNEHFAPSTLPSRDRQNLVTLKSTKQLLGRAGDRFLLLGMLSHTKEGNICLEDADGSVNLDFSKLDEPGEGLFTEGCFALVEGEYTEEGTLEIIAIGQPPCEAREVARSIYGHIDFLGKGATSILEDTRLAQRVQEDLANLHFFFLSDVWLDNPITFVGLQKLFDNCRDNDFIPKVIVLCGNFTSRSISHGNGQDIQRYTDNFDELAELISSYPEITRDTHFVFVPGPLDIAVNSILPRRPLISTFVSRLKNRVPHVHFATNPCRIKFFHQEIVVFREDLMSRILRNTVGVKPDIQSGDLKKYLVQTVLDQAHLNPFVVNISPTLSDFDHTLRLYPLPTVVVLADKYDRYKVTYTGCHVFNPGSFVRNSFSFWAYKPAECNSEEWQHPGDVRT